VHCVTNKVSTIKTLELRNISTLLILSTLNTIGCSKHDYNIVHISDPFHKECLIILTHLQHKAVLIQLICSISVH